MDNKKTLLIKRKALEKLKNVKPPELGEISSELDELIENELKTLRILHIKSNIKRIKLQMEFLKDLKDAFTPNDNTDITWSTLQSYLIEKKQEIDAEKTLLDKFKKIVNKYQNTTTMQELQDLNEAIIVDSNNEDTIKNNQIKSEIMLLTRNAFNMQDEDDGYISKLNAPVAYLYTLRAKAQMKGKKQTPPLFISDILKARNHYIDSKIPCHRLFVRNKLLFNILHVRGIVVLVDDPKIIIDDGTGQLIGTVDKVQIKTHSKKVPIITNKEFNTINSYGEVAYIHNVNIGDIVQIKGTLSTFKGEKYFFIEKICIEKTSSLLREIDYVKYVKKHCIIYPKRSFVC